LRELVEAGRVGVQELPLYFLRDVIARAGDAGRLRPVAIPVRVVRRIQQRVLEAPAHSVRDRLLAALDAEVDAAATDVVAGLAPELGCLGCASLLELLVHPIHPEGNPTDAA